MINPSRNAALVSGLVLILMANIVLLASVAYNRTGESEFVIRLTEREVTLPHRRSFNKENSGLSLRIRWRAGYRQKYYNQSQNAPWLDESKLELLGFDLGRFSDVEGHTSLGVNLGAMEKQVLLVLEQDGDTYQERLMYLQEKIDLAKEELSTNSSDSQIKDKLSRAEKLLRREVESASRLYVIDAGLSADELREKYSDRDRYGIVSGRVKPVFSEPEIKGYIRGLMVPTVNVPLKQRAVLEPVIQQQRKKSAGGGPRYEATIAYGRGMEPRVIRISLLDAEKSVDQ